MAFVPLDSSLHVFPSPPFPLAQMGLYCLTPWAGTASSRDLGSSYNSSQWVWLGLWLGTGHREAGPFPTKGGILPKPIYSCLFSSSSHGLNILASIFYHSAGCMPLPLPSLFRSLQIVTTTTISSWKPPRVIWLLVACSLLGPCGSMSVSSCVRPSPQSVWGQVHTSNSTDAHQAEPQSFPIGTGLCQPDVV